MIDAPDCPSLAPLAIEFRDEFTAWARRVALHATGMEMSDLTADWVGDHKRMVRRAQFRMASRKILPPLIRMVIAKYLSDNDPED